jgi:hypothetical protein
MSSSTGFGCGNHYFQLLVFAAICQPSGFGWKKNLDEFIYQMNLPNTFVNEFI